MTKKSYDRPGRRGPGGGIGRRGLGLPAFCFCVRLAAELGIHVFAFHMNHGIRGAEADRDERFVDGTLRAVGDSAHRGA